MGHYKKNTTIRLPRSILEEIHEQDGQEGQHRGSSKKKRSLGRKEVRRQGRLEQKQKKAQFFSTGRKRRPEDEEPEGSESPQRKRARGDLVKNGESQDQVGSGRKGTQDKSVKKQESVIPREKTLTHTKRNEEKKKGIGKNSYNVLLPENKVEEEEDAYITYLEKKLGYARGEPKRKQDSLEEDGLDDLLNWADSFKLPMTGNVSPGEDESYGIDESEGGSEEESLEASGDEEQGGDTDSEEWGGILAPETEPKEQEIGSEENNIGRKRSSTPPEQSPAAPTTRYIPPHLRKKGEDLESETAKRLKKQLKGLLNRMSEQNLDSIIDGIEELYRNNRRHDVTSGITRLVIEGISSHSVLLDSYVVLHAALISSLHKVVGVEFAAYFVQDVVESYEHHHQGLQSDEAYRPVQSQPETQDQDPKGKECSNLIVLLSELYNFQVISSVLVFDLVRELLQGDLTEFNVELLLKLMRNSGQQLRHDDPSALKDIIDIVQKKIAGKDEKSLSSRTRFMIETLVNLKNNKLKRNVTQNQGGEAVERMKKFLTNINKKRHVLAHDAIRVSLRDLRSADSKGKWWLVGAAWSGNPLVDAQESIVNAQVNHQNTSTNGPPNDLLRLARKQGMNSDIRRSIFVVLMSSDDYVDACERLSQLSLTEVQQREIVRVLLHCCGNEKIYNPYYALVCQQLCRQSHSFKITLQFCLWDFLREMGEVTVGGTEVVKNARDDDAGFDLGKISVSRMFNVARAYAWWIAKDVVNLTILKAVDFTVLKPQSQQFLRELVLQIFTSSQTATPLIDASPLPTTRNRAAIEEIFVKATRIQNLAVGLAYFLNAAFANGFDGDENLLKFAKWANALALETLRTGVGVISRL